MTEQQLQLNLWDAGAPGASGGSGIKTGADVPARPPAAVREASIVSPQRARQWLTAILGRPVQLTITENRSTMMSCRERGSVMHLRLHRMFLTAPEQVWYALAAYLATSDVSAGKLLDAFIAAQPSPRRGAPVRVRTRGRYHDLTAIFAELNQTYFHNASQARVTWGQASARRRRRSIQLGCYLAEDNLIRIHPCLDQSFVPRQYVSWVMFHEMLHEVLGVEERHGRRQVHPPEFVALEQTFPNYAQCKAWEEANLDRLLRYRPPKR